MNKTHAILTGQAMPLDSINIFAGTFRGTNRIEYQRTSIVVQIESTPYTLAIKAVMGEKPTIIIPSPICWTEKNTQIIHR